MTLSRQRLETFSAAGKDVQAVMLPGADHLLFEHTWVPLGFAAALMPQLAAWLRDDAG